MPILVICQCGNQFHAKDEHAGRRAKCPKCGQQLTIPGESQPAFDVFISHAAADKTTADAVCAALEARGIRCWIAPRDILPGKEWGEAIIDGINECRAMLLVFSSNSNDSQQVRREVERAVSKGLLLVPFRIEDVPLSKSMEYFLSAPHWMDALTPPLEDHLQQLGETVEMLLPRLGIPRQPYVTDHPKSERDVGQEQPAVDTRATGRALSESSEDKAVEAALAEILEPLDDYIGSFYYFLPPLSACFAWPVMFLVLWLGFGFQWWSGLLWGLLCAVVLFIPAVIASDSSEKRVFRNGADAFNARFPTNGRERDAAMRILPEMKCPNKAQEKLLAALQPKIARAARKSKD